MHLVVVPEKRMNHVGQDVSVCKGNLKPEPPVDTVLPVFRAAPSSTYSFQARLA